MHLYFISLALAATASSLSVSPRADSSCPSVWSTVAEELQGTFAGCGRDAHGAIRAPFHDCINNGCDGSLITTDECGRSENAGLEQICGKLLEWTKKYNVSAADMIQFAAATAIAACPFSPPVQALVGRKDGTSAAPEGEVPRSRDSVSSILAAFAKKGISTTDVVALMGTHSVAVQVNDDPSQAGKSLDNTPSKWDTSFYKETMDGTAPYSLQSDKLLANSSDTEPTWSQFATDKSSWDAAFTSAWNKFAVIGNDVDSLVDCTSLIPASSNNARRSAGAGMFSMTGGSHAARAAAAGGARYHH